MVGELKISYCKMSTAAKKHKYTECGKAYVYGGRETLVVEQVMKWVGGWNGAPFWKPLIGLPDVTRINLVYRGGSRNFEMGGGGGGHQ